MKQEEIDKILNSDWAVRRNTAGNPNTPADVLTKLSEDSDWAVRRNTAGNPNTPADVLTKLSEDSHWAVRRNTAGNPNTPADVLTKLSEDSHCDVRSSTAGNPNTPADVLTKLSEDSHWAVRRNTAGNFIVTETYVAIQGTSHMWYKHNCEKPFYTCGCFIGSREQLVSRIRSVDQSKDPAVRLRILEALDRKFDEVFRSNQ
jgi:hypothetical protein